MSLQEYIRGLFNDDQAALLVTDPASADNPIVYVSRGFEIMTQVRPIPCPPISSPPSRPVFPFPYLSSVMRWCRETTRPSIRARRCWGGPVASYKGPAQIS